jgi:hypothetical protein
VERGLGDKGREAQKERKERRGGELTRRVMK